MVAQPSPTPQPAAPAAEPLLASVVSFAPTVTTGTAVIGAAAIMPELQDVLVDVAGWIHLPMGHPGAWAACILAGVGAWLHNRRTSANA